MDNLNIRDYIKNNLKDSNTEEINETINDTIKEGLEESLPGLGVLMEIIWENIDDNTKKELLEILKTHLS